MRPWRGEGCRGLLRSELAAKKKKVQQLEESIARQNREAAVQDRLLKDLKTQLRSVLHQQIDASPAVLLLCRP